mmetsp:Transcript_58370/g.186061  ORF Transcript_58370/g.186061 Transcript_58370/m.186061 type:complete len:687 (-) Transcript_58370:770-2830(-)
MPLLAVAAGRAGLPGDGREGLLHARRDGRVERVHGRGARLGVGGGGVHLALLLARRDLVALGLGVLLLLLLLLVVVAAVGKVVEQDGEEEVEDDVVANDGQQEEVEGGHGGGRPHAVVHHLVPVLAREDLEDGDDAPEDVVEVVPGHLHRAHHLVEHGGVHAQVRHDLRSRLAAALLRERLAQRQVVVHGPLDEAPLPNVALGALPVAVPVLGAQVLHAGGADGARVHHRLAELELVAEELHPQQREDEDEQQQDEAEVGDAREGLEDRVDDLVELLPAPRELEHAQQAEGAQHAQRAARAAHRLLQRDLHEGRDDHYPVEDVHPVLDVAHEAEADDLDDHLDAEVGREHVVDVLKGDLHLARHVMVLARHRDRVEDDQRHREVLEAHVSLDGEAYRLDLGPGLGDGYVCVLRVLRLLALPVLALVLHLFVARVSEIEVQDREGQVDREEGPEDDHENEVEPHPRVDRVLHEVHHVRPALHADALEDGEPRPQDVVEARDVVVRILEPGTREALGARPPHPPVRGWSILDGPVLVHGPATEVLLLFGEDLVAKGHRGGGVEHGLPTAVPHRPSKHLHPHDPKDEERKRAEDEHVQEHRQRPQQRDNEHAHPLHPRDRAQRPEHAHGTDGRVVPERGNKGHQPQHHHQEVHHVPPIPQVRPRRQDKPHARHLECHLCHKPDSEEIFG